MNESNYANPSIGSASTIVSPITRPQESYPNRGTNIWKGEIAPGKTSGPIPLAGNVYYILAANQSLSVKTDNNNFKEYFEAGLGEEVDPQSLFKKIEIRNDGDATLYVSVYIGFGTIIDNRLIVSSTSTVYTADQASSIIGTGTQSLDDGNSIDFNGDSPDIYQFTRRKNIVIQNLDGATNSLEIRDSEDNICYILPAGQSVVFQLSGFIRIHNSSGSSVSYAVGQVWYRV